MICQYGYVGEVSLSIKKLLCNLFQICPFEEATFFRNYASLRILLYLCSLKSGDLMPHSSNEVTMTHVSYMWRHMQ